jgi:hypothetical protein
MTGHLVNGVLAVLGAGRILYVAASLAALVVTYRARVTRIMEKRGGARGEGDGRGGYRRGWAVPGGRREGSFGGHSLVRAGFSGTMAQARPLPVPAGPPNYLLSANYAI